MNYYIRIGELPQDGKSKIYQWDDAEHTSRTAIGEEIGVSVYEAKKVKDKWTIILPKFATKTTFDTFRHLMDLVRTGKKSVYLVTGDEIGKGYDEEPVITNIKIIKTISKGE